MICARCGLHTPTGFYKQRTDGFGYIIVCGLCARTMEESRTRLVAIATAIMVGSASLLLWMLAGCVSPLPAYPPWEGPGPMPQPGWTNSTANSQ